MRTLETEFGSEADVEFEVDARHRSREDGKILLVEEIVDSQFELQVKRTEGEVLLQ